MMNNTGKGNDGSDVEVETGGLETIVRDSSEEEATSTETVEAVDVDVVITEEKPVEEKINSTVPSEKDFIEAHSAEKEFVVANAAVVVQGAGHQLRTARIALSMSVDDASRHLRLSVKQIEAIEKEDYEKLPGRTFLRGFMRNYANLVHLNPVSVLQLLPPSLSAVAVVKNASHQTKQTKKVSFTSDPMWIRRSNQRSVWGGLLFKAVLLILFLAIVYSAYKSDIWDRMSQVKEENVGSFSETFEGVNGQTTMELQLPLSPVISSENQSATHSPQATEINQEGNDRISSEEFISAVAPDIKQMEGDQGTLYFMFMGESWVKVNDGADKVIFEETSARGAERVISGKRPLSLVIGNAINVNLIYNDRTIDLTPYIDHNDGVARLALE